MRMRHRIRQVLNSFRLPLEHMFADAGFDPKTGIAVIAIVKNDLTCQEHKFVKATSINDAELQAVRMALDKYPHLKVATDSTYAVAHSDADKVYHVSRRQNIANLIVRSATEQAKSKVPHGIS